MGYIQQSIEKKGFGFAYNYNSKPYTTDLSCAGLKFKGK
jgi:hypothetical protein